MKAHFFKSSCFATLLAIEFILLAISFSVSAQVSVVVSAKAYAPTVSQRQANGYGTDKIQAMNDACDRYSEEDSYVEGNGRLECAVQADGDRYTCYSGFGSNKFWIGACASYLERDCLTSAAEECNGLPMKNNGCTAGVGDNLKGNPCNVSTGNKLHFLPLFAGSIPLTLTYNSYDFTNNRLFGIGWSSSLHKRLSYLDLDEKDSIAFTDESGRVEVWRWVDESWVGDEDSDIIVSEQSQDQFLVHISDGSTISFNLSDYNFPVREDMPNGGYRTYIHSLSGGSINKTEVTNQYGQKVIFRYFSSGKVRYVVDTNGMYFWFNYQGLAGNQLREIVFDSASADQSSDSMLVFHYEDQNHERLLTGITDENGNRYSTYAYDADGKAISTEHSQTTNAVGQERFELDYQ